VLRNEDIADAYVKVTDGCRYLIPPASHIVRLAQRVKPDEETHPEAELDFEQEPTRWRAVGAGY